MESKLERQELEIFSPGSSDELCPGWWSETEEGMAVRKFKREKRPCGVLKARE